MISLATSDVNFKSWVNIADCLISKRLGRGKYVDRFEKEAAEYFGVSHAIAVSNGTMADIVMLMVLKEMYPEKDEVILPALTFVAQSNAVVMAGLTPKFVDVNENYTINWNGVDATNALCAFPVHLLGKDAGIPAIVNAPVIEDCCEAMGGQDAFGNKFGTIGLMGSFSMFPSHTITTGEGGFVITNSDECNLIARSVINHGKWQSNDFDFKRIGINAKMTNLQAAIGCSLVDGIYSVNERRQMNVEQYNYILEENFSTQAPHCYPVQYSSKFARDAALVKLRESGIEARKLMGCIPEYGFYKDKFKDMGEFPTASLLANQGLFVPVHQNLTCAEIERICDVIHETRQ